MFKCDWQSSGDSDWQFDWQGSDDKPGNSSVNKKGKQINSKKKKRLANKEPSVDFNSSAVEAAFERANKKLNLCSELENEPTEIKRLTGNDIECIINPSLAPVLKSVLKTPDANNKKNSNRKLSVSFSGLSDFEQEMYNDSQIKKERKLKKITKFQKESNPDSSSNFTVEVNVTNGNKKDSVNGNIETEIKKNKKRDKKKTLKENGIIPSSLMNNDGLVKEIVQNDDKKLNKKRKAELNSLDVKCEPIPKLIKMNNNSEVKGNKKIKKGKETKLKASLEISTKTVSQPKLVEVKSKYKNNIKENNVKNIDNERKSKILSVLENSDDEENWEVLSDCSESEADFDGDTDDDEESIRKDLKSFMAGLDFEGAHKKMRESKSDLEDESIDLLESEMEYEEKNDDSEKEEIDDSKAEEENGDSEGEVLEEEEHSGDDDDHSDEDTSYSEKDITPPKVAQVKEKIHVGASVSNSIKESMAKFNAKEINSKSKPTKPKTMIEKLNAQLNAAKFRMINEQLYTMSGDKAFKMFKKDPSSFKIYHDGFKTQVSLWPMNPLDSITEWLKTQNKSWVVADFGCGEGELSERVDQKVHSFDLVAAKPHVTACDMSNVPLPPLSVNVAVFCLSLMGTNINDFIKEANRVLKNGGIMKVSEVKSRISNIDEFVSNIQKCGFKCFRKPTDDKYFISFDFKKFRNVKNKELPELKLKPCLYKRR